MEKVLKCGPSVFVQQRAAVATPINLENRAGSNPKKAGIGIVHSLKQRINCHSQFSEKELARRVSFPIPKDRNLPSPTRKRNIECKNDGNGIGGEH